MTALPVARWRSMAALAIAVVGALWIVNLLAARTGGWTPHAVSHLSGSIVGALLAAGVAKLRRLQTIRWSHMGDVAPVALLAGLAWFATSQLVEALSAIVEYPESGSIHTVSGVSTMFGMVVALAAAIFLATAAIIRRKLPAWTILLLLIAGVLLVVGLMVGFPVGSGE